jgi:hypothetical protein
MCSDLGKSMKYKKKLQKDTDSEKTALIRETLKKLEEKNRAFLCSDLGKSIK